MSTNSHNQCNEQLIHDLLSGTISTPQQSELEFHLETCDQCRATLHAHASDEKHWQAATRYLTDDGLDGSAYGTRAPFSSHGAAANPAEGATTSSSELCDIRATDSASAVIIRQIITWLNLQKSSPS